MSAMDHGATEVADGGGAEHGAMNMRDKSLAPPGMQVGPGVDIIAMSPQDSAGKPGLGLEEVDHRVLVYSDLVALKPNTVPRPPSRSLEIQLTGNMERFKKFRDTGDFARAAGEDRGGWLAVLGSKVMVLTAVVLAAPG